MTNPPIKNQKPEIKNEEAATGLPVLRTWPRVYIFILAAFALTVLLLIWFTRAFA